MKSYSFYKRIAKLIVGEIGSSLTKSEESELANWTNENPINKEFFHEIRNSRNYQKWVKEQEEAEIRKNWEYILQIIQKDKKQILLRKIGKYAAGILLPLLIAGGSYYFLKPAPDQTMIIQTSEIKSGSSQALLILNNGQSISLDAKNEIYLREKDGTTIQKTEGKLNYSSTEKRKSDTPLFNVIQIPKGGEYNLVLSDGTRVYLNSVSELRYPVRFNGVVREVQLKGEAYFEVSHSKTPFIVKTKEMNVEVQGTSFNVNAYENTGKTITTLVEGKVKIETKDKLSINKILSPDEQAVFDLSDKSVKVDKVDVSLYTGWKEGKFIFHNEKLKNIMDVLTRWYSAEVLFMNRSAEDLRFSGSIDRYGDISQILEIIKSTNKVKITVNKTVIVFEEKN